MSVCSIILTECSQQISDAANILRKFAKMLIVKNSCRLCCFICSTRVKNVSRLYPNTFISAQIIVRIAVVFL